MTLRALKTHMHRTIRCWHRRPLWTAALLLLMGLVMLGGPGTCLAHCLLDHVPPAEAAGHLRHAGHHGAHAAAPASDHDPCLDDHGSPSAPQSLHQEPSPLTIAVLLPGTVLLQLGSRLRDRVPPQLRLRSHVLPPPLPPPRPAGVAH